jgi:ABC-type Zn uptake system ZnuABC Zn-binding protein ZnuA
VLCAAQVAVAKKLHVISTIPDFASIAEEVGGSCVKAESLVRPNQDPHFVDGKPSMVVALNKADLLLVTGMELEGGWLPALITGARNGGIQRGAAGYLDLSTSIEPMDVQAPDRAKGDIHPGGNPHYWTDPRNGARIARKIAAKLIELDPDHACDIRSRLHSFLNRLEDRMAEWQRKLAPYKGTKVVVYHKSWVYFLDWVGFERVGALEPKPGVPPKPSHVAQLIKKVRNQEVKYVIQESFYPTNLSKIFAQKSGAKLRVLPTMVGSAGTHTYFDVIDKLVSELTN